MSNALDPDQDQKNPDQDRHSVCADLGTNYLQRLSAEDKLNKGNLFSHIREISCSLKNLYALDEIL